MSIDRLPLKEKLKVVATEAQRQNPSNLSWDDIYETFIEWNQKGQLTAQAIDLAYDAISKGEPIMLNLGFSDEGGKP